MNSLGSEEARKQLSELLEQAYRYGQRTVITKQGVAYAVLVPVDDLPPSQSVKAMSALRGSGRGCYGNASDYVEATRQQWD